MKTVEPATTGTFIGRESELARLTTLLDETIVGRGGVALVAGEPGIGKTRLVEELTGLTHGRSVRTLWGRCYEAEGAPAFWPWLQILRDLLRTRSPDALQSVVRPAVDDLSALLSELHGTAPDGEGTALLDPLQARFRLFEGVTTLLRALAPSPLSGTTAQASPSRATSWSRHGLLLIFEDLHWADEPSLLMLRYLAPHLSEMGVLVVGTYRDTALSREHPLSALLGVIAGRHRVVSVPLRGLPDATVARLVEDAGVPTSPHTVRAIVRRSEGNPLFVRELLSLLAVPGTPDVATRRLPRTLHGMIGRRLQALSAPSRDLLTIAAVIGREFSLAVISEVAGDQSTLAAMIEEAERLDLVAAAPGGYERYCFTHGLIREVLYEELPTLRRARLHLRVGEALAALAGLEPTPAAAELAHHFMQAAAVGGAARACAYAHAAGDLALAQLAYEEAARQYALGLQALDLTSTADARTRCELLLGLGEARISAGETEAGQAALWSAADAARLVGRERGSGRLLARAALGIGGFALSIHPPMGRLVALIEEALASLEPEDEALRSQMLGRLAMELHAESDEARRDALSREAVAIARRTGDARTLATALLVRHNAMRGPDAARLLPLTTEALTLARQAGDPSLTLWISRVHGADLCEVGDFAAFGQARAAHGRLAERLRDPYHRWQHAVWLAMQAALAGRFDEAAALAGQAREAGRATPTDLADLFYAAQLAAISLETGGHADGLAAFRMMPERFPALDGLPAMLAVLHLAAGERTDAWATYARLVTGGAHANSGVREFAGLRRGGMWLMTMALLARAAVQLEDGPRMRRLYALLLPYAHLNVMMNPGVFCLGSVSYHLGLLAGTVLRVGEPASDADPDEVPTSIGQEDAERHLLHALALHERIGAPALMAHTRYVYAQLLLDQSRRAGAAAGSDRRTLGLLEQAATAAELLGMQPLVRAVARLLDGGQEQQPPERPSARLRAISLPGSLTGREAEVLRLLAAGATNKAIGAALYLSPNTVRQHTISIYRKTGATGRAEATAWAARHGLLDQEDQGSTPPDRSSPGCPSLTPPASVLSHL